MLDSPRPIIVYKPFIKTFNDLNKESTRDLEKDLITELKKISTQPEPNGKMHMDRTELQGKTYKFYIGGEKEYRAIWVKWDYKNVEIILLLFITESKRKDIDYRRDIEPNIWDPIEEILNALSNKDYSIFEEWYIIGNGIVKLN